MRVGRFIPIVYLKMLIYCSEVKRRVLVFVAVSIEGLRRMGKKPMDQITNGVDGIFSKRDDSVLYLRDLQPSEPTMKLFHLTVVVLTFFPDQSHFKNLMTAMDPLLRQINIHTDGLYIHLYPPQSFPWIHLKSPYISTSRKITIPEDFVAFFLIYAEDVFNYLNLFYIVLFYSVLMRFRLWFMLIVFSIELCYSISHTILFFLVFLFVVLFWYSVLSKTTATIFLKPYAFLQCDCHSLIRRWSLIPQPWTWKACDCFDQ